MFSACSSLPFKMEFGLATFKSVLPNHNDMIMCERGGRISAIEAALVYGRTVVAAIPLISRRSASVVGCVSDFKAMKLQTLLAFR